ncbi:MAG: deoxyribodipyrimidine photo-lyase [Halioglobus sp.]|jgi:deoxyribodipyrimidine photo-lyase
MMNSPIIFWFRQDLRTHDLPGLFAAAATGRPIVPCYILDDASPGHWRVGEASRWWLHHSLLSLAGDLSGLGACLVLRNGEAGAELEKLQRETGAQDIYCTRMYEPWAADLEQRLHKRFSADGISFKRYGGALLHEPESILNLSDQPYKVFTPFWRKCRSKPEPALPQALSPDVNWLPKSFDSDALEDWQLCPTQPNWANEWSKWWSPGGDGARSKLEKFLEKGIESYSDGRNHPALDCTTRLSPHLHYGEISPREVWHRARSASAMDSKLEGQVDKFFSELGWREFSHHLMHSYPDIPETAFKPAFRQFPFIDDQVKLAAWQSGHTGYPLVDAGMRELWQTGYMHNRVRMIVASFLTKHLLIHWKEGAKWFWNTLLDADLANNSGGWQWVAGCGADASPYFRIFNPVIQGKKFDVRGEYIRKWVPELKDMPDRYLNTPWDAPEDVLKMAGIDLGTDYPHPVVDHQAAREGALAALASIREASE